MSREQEPMSERTTQTKVSKWVSKQVGKSCKIRKWSRVNRDQWKWTTLADCTRPLMQNTPQEDRGENPRGLKVCLTCLRTEQKSKSRCGSSEAKCRVKITTEIPGRWIGTVCVQSYSIYSPSFWHIMDVFWPNGMLTWLLVMQYWYDSFTNATVCLTKLLRYRDDCWSNTWDAQTLLQITTALFIKNYDRQLLQVTRARIITTYDKVITNYDITSITTLILHVWINECKHFCEHSLSFMPSILSQKNLVELLRSILGTPLTEWLGWSRAFPWYLAQPPILRAAPCKYRLWPCKIEKSNVLKLFLGITLGSPITETAIWIALGNYFFSYLTLLFWCAPAGKINWKLGFLRGLVRTNATVDRNTNYFIPLLRYWSLFSVVLIRIRFKWELWHIF